MSSAPLFGPYQKYYDPIPRNVPPLLEKGMMVIHPGINKNEYVAIFQNVDNLTQRICVYVTPEHFFCDKWPYFSFREILNDYRAEVNDPSPTEELLEDSKTAESPPPPKRSILESLRERRILMQQREAPSANSPLPLSSWAAKLTSIVIAVAKNLDAAQSVIDQVQDRRWYCSCEVLADLQVLTLAAFNNPNTFAIFANGTSEYPYRLISYNRKSAQPLDLLFRIKGEHIQPQGSEVSYTFPGFLLAHGLDTKSGIRALMNK